MVSFLKVTSEVKIVLNCFPTSVLDTKNKMLISPPTSFFPWDPGDLPVIQKLKVSDWPSCSGLRAPTPASAASQDLFCRAAASALECVEYFDHSH